MLIFNTLVHMTRKEIQDEISNTLRVINKTYNELINRCEDKIKKLQKELEELNKPKRCKPKNYEIYFYIDSCGRINRQLWYNTGIDNFRYETRNCFKTKEEAEEELERILFVNEVRDFIEEENEGWEPDFSHSKKTGFYLYINNTYVNNKPIIGDSGSNMLTSTYKYFKSKEIGEKILAKFDNQKLIKWWI